MKNIIALTLITATLSTNGFAASRELECAGRIPGDAQDFIVTAEVVSNVKLIHAVSSDGTLSPKVLKADRKYRPKKYLNSNRFNYSVTSENGLTYSCGLILPKNLLEQEERFEGVDLCQSEDSDGVGITLRMRCLLK